MAVLSLRRRLTLLVALTIVVPITAVGVTVVNLIGNEVDQRSYDRLHQAAAFVQGALNQGSTDVARAADALAADPRTADAIAADGSGLDDTLRRALVDHDLDVVVVQDEHGAVVGSARRDPQYAPGVVVPADEDLASGARDLAVLTARAPLATGTVVTGRWIDAFRLRRVVAGDVTFTLTDGGRSVASTASVSLPHRALDGDFRADLGGHRRLAFATPAASGSPFTLVATTRPSAAGGRTNLILIFGALLLILTILIVLVGHVVSGLVTGPVEDLVIAALAVSRGDLTQRVKPAGDVELAALGRAFNQMTDNLQEHVAQLEQSRTEFQAAMARLGDVLVSTHDIGGIIDVVLEACTLTLHADEALFFERVAMPARIRASAAQSWSVPALELNGTGVAGAAAKALALVTYPAPDIELAEGEPEETVAMAVPVVSDGRLFGVIAVYGHHGDDPFDERDVNTLQTLARQAEVAIGNVHLHDETRRQARTDGTTGLWNRREFELRARESVKEAARFHEPFGVILVDIDNFKQVNDRYDHSTGDAALIWLASKLSEATREIDVVARWGGEEFIVLLPRAGAEESAMVAERIRSTIAQEPMVDGPKIIPITVSIGMACHPDDGATPDSLFKAADAALLRAKRMGKNRVERARPEEGVA